MMPNTPVKDVNGIGTRRLKTSGANGPADRFSSQSLINPDGVISQIDNNGVQAFVIRGDGRRNGGILAAVPGTLIPGDCYIVTILGVDYWAFVDTGGTQHLFNPALYQLLSEKGAINGYAPLDGTARVPTVNLPTTVQYTGDKGAANGYAGLDASALLLVANLPSIPLANLPAPVRAVQTVATPVPPATTTTIDSLLLTDATTCQWIVELTDTLGFYGSFPVLASVESPVTIGFTQGTATSVAAGFIEFSATVDISAGDIRLRIIATGLAPVGWTARARRIQIV